MIHNIKICVSDFQQTLIQWYTLVHRRGTECEVLNLWAEVTGTVNIVLTDACINFLNKSKWNKSLNKHSNIIKSFGEMNDSIV